jgi:hypothetical protein
MPGSGYTRNMLARTSRTEIPMSPAEIVASVDKPQRLKAAEARIAALGDQRSAAVEALRQTIAAGYARRDDAETAIPAKRLEQERLALEKQIAAIRRESADLRQAHAAAVATALLPLLHAEAREIIRHSQALGQSLARLGDVYAAGAGSGADLPALPGLFGLYSLEIQCRLLLGEVSP